ncbi:hypothetical protein TcBrA4_0042790 [Trypanosoma cruzi]|nr:hypothetical protein TcBrA4_0042790 [Trypanosoma cruzi]
MLASVLRRGGHEASSSASHHIIAPVAALERAAPYTRFNTLRMHAHREGNFRAAACRLARVEGPGTAGPVCALRDAVAHPPRGPARCGHVVWHGALCHEEFFWYFALASCDAVVHLGHIRIRHPRGHIRTPHASQRMGVEEPRRRLCDGLRWRGIGMEPTGMSQ